MQHIPSNFTPEEVLGFVPDDNVLKPIVEVLLEKNSQLEGEVRSLYNSRERAQEQANFMRDWIFLVKTHLELGGLKRGKSEELLTELENSFIEL